MDNLVAQHSVLTQLRMSIARSNILRGNSERYWAVEAEEANMARLDENLMRESEKFGLGYANIPQQVDQPPMADSQEDSPQEVNADGATSTPLPYQLRGQVHRRVENVVGLFKGMEGGGANLRVER